MKFYQNSKNIIEGYFIILQNKFDITIYVFDSSVNLCLKYCVCSLYAVSYKFSRCFPKISHRDVLIRSEQNIQVRPKASSIEGQSQRVNFYDQAELKSCHIVVKLIFFLFNVFGRIKYTRIRRDFITNWKVRTALSRSVVRIRLRLNSISFQK